MHVFMGGTFDPIHHGHLRAALDVQQLLGCQQVQLMPARTPVHRQGVSCSAEHRLAMLQLAVAGEAALSADARELESDEHCYSVLTLEGIRRQFGPELAVVMVIGMDSFLSLPRWHRWRELLGLCHLLVLHRPGYAAEPCEQLQALLDEHQSDSVASFADAPCGSLVLHQQRLLDISATQIRQLVASGQSPRYLLPDAVWQYIQQHQLLGLKD